MAILSNDKRDVSISNDFKTSEFKIQASAKAFEILSSNIYTNKVRAVIREYNCNAYDAHVAAGTYPDVASESYCGSFSATGACNRGSPGT